MANIVKVDIEEAELFWGDNDIGISSMGATYVTPDGKEHHGTFWTRGQGYWNGEWLSGMEKVSREGSDSIIKTELQESGLENVQIEYVGKSPSLDKNSLSKIYSYLEGIATPKTVRRLYLKHFDAKEAEDLNPQIEKSHIFLFRDTSIRACADFKVTGKLRKYIASDPFRSENLDEKDFVLHTGYTDRSGGFFIEGKLNKLKPHLIITERPKIFFDIDKSVGKDARRFLRSLRYPFHSKPFSFKIGFPADHPDTFHNIRTLECEYDMDDKEIIRWVVEVMILHGLDIKRKDDGRYIVRDKLKKKRSLNPLRFFKH